MRRIFIRSKDNLVSVQGYVELSAACVKANQTGFFALNQRVAPDSYDSSTRDIDPRNCFIGGRRVELAVNAKNYGDFATRGSDNGVSLDDGSNGNTNKET